jgi:hypothetical protein
MKLLILTLLFCFSSKASESVELLRKSAIYGADCSKHKIFCQIRKNNPKVTKEYAMQLSNIIHSVTKKYNLRPHIYTAILAQESMYQLKAINCTTGVKLYDANNPLNEEEIVCVDFGISQINYKTAKAYEFDLTKLVSDSIEAGAIVLSDMKKRYHEDDIHYWTRYNSSKKTFREEYRRLVERFM